MGLQYLGHIAMTRRIAWLLGGAACGLAVSVAIFLVFKLDHIQFMMLSGLADLPKIPVEDFPQDDVSAPSCRLTWQGFEMNVPGRSAEKSHAEVKLLNWVPWLLLSPERGKGSKGMIVIFPLDATPPPGPAMFEMPQPEQDGPESHASEVAQLAEIYRVGRSDFRWTSSSSEVRRLRWFLLNAEVEAVR